MLYMRYATIARKVQQNLPFVKLTNETAIHPNPTAGDIFCVGTDGTGAPMRRKELKGRKGKRGGKARTREVKVGTVFTHHQPEKPDQRPVRDHGSTTYIAEINCARDFGALLRAE